MMVQILERSAVEINLVTAVRVARTVHGLTGEGLDDRGLVISSVLSSAFGGHTTLRPWSSSGQEGSTMRIVGYAKAEDLEQGLFAASPAAAEPIGRRHTVAPVEVKSGTRYRFQVVGCPTCRDQEGRERDAYEHNVRSLGIDAAPPREEVYTKWLVRRLTGADVRHVRVDGLRRDTLIRPVHAKGKRTWARMQRSAVTFQGLLRVTDEDTFAAAVRAGIGRQSAYGFGYLWLEPVQ